MPPQKKDKKKHYRGKQFTNYEEDSRDQVKWRNRKEGDADDSSSSEEEEEGDGSPSNKKNVGELEKGVKDIKVGEDSDDDQPAVPIFERALFNNKGLNPTDADMASQGLSRKQREELEKEQKRKKYEKLHAEGKTEEAQADLARLAKIREQREKAKKEKEIKQAEEELVAKGKAAKANAKKEFVEALGGEASLKTSKGKKKKKSSKDEASDGEQQQQQQQPLSSTSTTKSGSKKTTTTSSSSGNPYATPYGAPVVGGPKKDAVSAGNAGGNASVSARVHQDQAMGMYDSFKTGKAAELIDKSKVEAGTIDACRAEEEDFM